MKRSSAAGRQHYIATLSTLIPNNIINQTAVYPCNQRRRLVCPEVAYHVIAVDSDKFVGHEYDTVIKAAELSRINSSAGLKLMNSSNISFCQQGRMS